MISFVRRSGIPIYALAFLVECGFATAQQNPVVLARANSTIVLEPYAPNIVRVTLSRLKDKALAPPGYGFSASSSAAGWKLQQDNREDIYTSDRLVVLVSASQPPHPTANDLQLAPFFASFRGPQAHITISTPQGKMLVDMLNWSMLLPNDASGNDEILSNQRPSDDPFYRVGATFASPPDEHYYGLGQNQEGFLDHRGHPVNCWHDYAAPGGESVCVPFLVSSRGYGLVWDNPSKTTIEAGFNEQTKWTSQVGDRVSFFVIAGKDSDEIYSGYQTLTGVTPLLPKAAYGFIQSKQRYDSQEEILGVAKGYRNRHLPADMIVVDFLCYTRMGQMDMNPAKWPDPEAMNRQLHAMGYQSMISIWPRFAAGSQYYEMLLHNGRFEHHADGKPTNDNPNDRLGSDIDTTNPDAARWFWETIRDRFVAKGFDSIWLDETEPDLPPDNSHFFVGPGQRCHNVYPLFHTASVYDGFRRDSQQRVLILARAAYLGAQHSGTIFWSSAIYPTWDTLKRQVPAGLNFAASGLAYWCNDVGGFLNLPPVHHPSHLPLTDPSDARANVGGYDDYPELYVRWYEYGVFEPIFRTHGTRNYNEIWSYGKQAEPILEKYLRLRYELSPYIYSLGYRTCTTGAPYMRGLFMDFPNDPKVADIGDEYMFGPAFLVAPITDQGATSRSVYLPAGAEWYNYWTNEHFVAARPSEQTPRLIPFLSLFAPAQFCRSARRSRTPAKSRSSRRFAYPGADGDFWLYNDDGRTYAYEKGDVRITHLHWDDEAGRFTHSGAEVWTAPDPDLVEVVKR